MSNAHKSYPEADFPHRSKETSVDRCVHEKVKSSAEGRFM